MSTSIFEGKRIAVMMGGTAAERDISLESGTNVAQVLVDCGAEVLRVDPAQQDWPANLQDVDFTFNLLHGRGGEDGTVQGLLELMRMPYSGSGVLGSALTMDKLRTKWLWRGAGLPTPDFEVLTAKSDWQAIIHRYERVFVKPAFEGSSLGMSRAETPEALEKAFNNARHYGELVLAESFVDGPEYTVAILGDRALPVIGIRPEGGFYDFNAKYVSDATGFECPANLSSADAAELSALALTAFQTTGAAVWGRVDVMRSAAGDWQLLEVNTIPGMTSHSLVPMASAAAGITTAELLAEICQLSLEERAHGR